MKKTYKLTVNSLAKLAPAAAIALALVGVATRAFHSEKTAASWTSRSTTDDQFYNDNPEMAQPGWNYRESSPESKRRAQLATEEKEQEVTRLDRLSRELIGNKQPSSGHFPCAATVEGGPKVAHSEYVTYDLGRPHKIVRWRPEFKVETDPGESGIGFDVQIEALRPHSSASRSEGQWEMCNLTASESRKPTLIWPPVTARFVRVRANAYTEEQHRGKLIVTLSTVEMYGYPLREK